MYKYNNSFAVNFQSVIKEMTKSLIFSSIPKIRAIVVIIILTAFCSQPDFAFARIFQLPASGFDLLLPFKLCRIYKFEDKSDSADLYASDNVTNFILSNKNGSLAFLSSDDFKLLWNLEIGKKINSNIIADEQNLFVIVLDESKQKYLLMQISKKAGLPQWETALDVYFEPNAFKFEEVSNDWRNNFQVSILKDFVIALSIDGNVFCFDKTNGNLIWKKRVANKLLSVPFLINNQLFVSTDEKKILKILIADGVQSVGDINTEIVPKVITVLSDGNIISGDVSGNIYSLNEASRRVNWKVRVGAEITNIIQTPSGLLISSLDNFTYLIESRNGKRRWKKRMPGRVLQKPLILGNYAVVSNSAQASAEVIDLQNGKTVNSLNLPDGQFFTGEIISNNNALFFSTSDGIFSFLNANQDCGLKSL